MRNKLIRIAVLGTLMFAARQQVFSQGSFVNLDFEDGTFIPIPGGFNTVEFDPAMPGWTGYLGTNQINSIWYNDRSLSGAGMAIYGPDKPFPDALHGHYFVILQNFFPTPSLAPAIAQTGTIPGDAASVRFYSLSQIVITLGVTFNGN